MAFFKPCWWWLDWHPAWRLVDATFAPSGPGWSWLVAITRVVSDVSTDDISRTSFPAARQLPAAKLMTAERYAVARKWRLKKHARGRLEAKAGDRAGEEGGCSNGGSSQDET